VVSDFVGRGLFFHRQDCFFFWPMLCSWVIVGFFFVMGGLFLCWFVLLL
jgi:hypothetical protein